MRKYKLPELDKFYKNQCKDIIICSDPDWPESKIYCKSIPDKKASYGPLMEAKAASDNKQA